jgi:HK97 family phage major capsid protein
MRAPAGTRKCDERRVWRDSRNTDLERTVTNVKITYSKNAQGKIIEHRDYGADGAGPAERSLSAHDLELLWSEIEANPSKYPVNRHGDGSAREALARSIKGDAVTIQQKAKDSLIVRSPDNTTRDLRAPYVVKQMSEREVYATDRMTASLTYGDHHAIIERAERAVELGHYPGDQDRAKEHITDLLHRGNDQDFSADYVARLILATGNPAYRSAFVKYLQSVSTGMPAVFNTDELKAIQRVDQVRALSVGTGSAGGFAVPYQLDQTLLPTSAGSAKPYRRVCRVVQTTSNEWRGVSTGGMTLSYAAESAVVGDNSVTLAQPAIVTARAHGFVPLSYELAADWDGILDQLGAEFQRAKNDLEAVKFTTGTGTNEPFGLITGATGTTNAGVAAVAPANLYALEQALNPRFRTKAVMFANKAILNDLLQDAATAAGAAAIWLPNTSDRPDPGSGYTLIGYPFGEASGMAAVLTAGSKIVVIFDPSYFVIVDRIGMDIEVIPNLFQQAVAGVGVGMPTGQRGIYCLIRNGSKLLDPAAARVLVTT